jgi:D-3-phosphoglycerate dehydrogenase / 2-oxoglutarate reductase
LIVSTYRLSEKSESLLNEFNLINGSDKKEDVSKATVLLGWPDSLRRNVQFAEHLEAIQTFSAGVDDLPFHQIPESVKIFSNAGAYSQSVSEHAIALILSLSKSVNRKDPPASYGVAGKTMAILGGGGIGSSVAKIARNGFGCRTIGISRSFQHPENFDEALPVEKLDYVLGSADIVVCALPLNKSTHNLLARNRLEKMRKKVVIVNVGRAEAINEEDIYSFLVGNPEARFGTDVFWRVNSAENFASKLWTLPNFAGTYHRAGAPASPEVKEEAVELAVINARNYLLHNGRVRNLVKRDDYV